MKWYTEVRHCLLAAALAACGWSDGNSDVSDSTFVDTMARLHIVNRNATLDSAAQVVARQATLQDKGLTPADIDRAARALAEDPDRAVAVWTAIDRRILELSTRGEP